MGSVRTHFIAHVQLSAIRNGSSSIRIPEFFGEIRIKNRCYRFILQSDAVICSLHHRIVEEVMVTIGRNGNA